MRGRQFTREERFWQHVDKSDTCWNWTASTKPFGYGRFVTRNHYKQKEELAHRVSWELHYGPIPQGMFVCHKCDNPPCVNPEHLFLGTGDDNMKDRNSKQRQAKGERHGKFIHGRYVDWRQKFDR
jgi:hypothetical protein